MAPKENSLKKNYSFSFIFVIYLSKEVYRKIMSEIHFLGKTRYEDLTETGSKFYRYAFAILSNVTVMHDLPLQGVTGGYTGLQANTGD